MITCKNCGGHAFVVFKGKFSALKSLTYRKYLVGTFPLSGDFFESKEDITVFPERLFAVCSICNTDVEDPEDLGALEGFLPYVFDKVLINPN